jgi:hypothetical protein
MPCADSAEVAGAFAIGETHWRTRQAQCGPLPVRRKAGLPRPHAACTSAEVGCGRVHVRALVRYLRMEQRKVRWEVHRNAANWGLARKARHVRVRPALCRERHRYLGPPSFDRSGPQRAVEQIAEQFSRALGDNDRVRFGKRLQTRGKVRRLPDNRLLLSRTLPD